MNRTNHRLVAGLAAITLIASLLLAAGCGKKEDTAPGGNYYTGPMTTKKNAATGTSVPAGATR